MATTNGCNLLELPAELRNWIFELTFTDNTVSLDSTNTAPGIIMACKQTYAETHGTYLRLITFRSTTFSSIRKALGKIPAEKLALINRVILDDRHESDLANISPDVRLVLSAHNAQTRLFIYMECESGRSGPMPQDSALMASFETADNNFDASSAPWESFHSSILKLSPAQLRDRGLDENGWLEMIARQSRFFDHAHEFPSKCWNIEWGTRDRCKCPRIKEE